MVPMINGTTNEMTIICNDYTVCNLHRRVKKIKKGVRPFWCYQPTLLMTCYMLHASSIKNIWKIQFSAKGFILCPPSYRFRARAFSFYATPHHIDVVLPKRACLHCYCISFTLSCMTHLCSIHVWPNFYTSVLYIQWSCRCLVIALQLRGGYGFPLLTFYFLLTFLTFWLCVCNVVVSHHFQIQVRCAIYALLTCRATGCLHVQPNINFFTKRRHWLWRNVWCRILDHCRHLAYGVTQYAYVETLGIW